MYKLHRILFLTSVYIYLVGISTKDHMFCINSTTYSEKYKKKSNSGNIRTCIHSGVREIGLHISLREVHGTFSRLKQYETTRKLS